MIISRHLIRILIKILERLRWKIENSLVYRAGSRSAVHRTTLPQREKNGKTGRGRRERDCELKQVLSYIINLKYFSKYKVC